MTKKKPIETLPLFDYDLTGALKPERTWRPFPGPRTIRRVICNAGAHVAALILSDDGAHLLWRPHDVHTAGGAGWPCRASGVDLCDAPAPEVPGKHCPTCDEPRPPEGAAGCFGDLL